MMKAACITAWMVLAVVAPAFGQSAGGTKSPGPAPASPAAPSEAPPAPASDAEFDVDTYTCQDDLAAKRQNRIGIAILVIYAQLRAAGTPDDHHFSLATIQHIASGSGATCATGKRERLLRDVVAEQIAANAH
jgi:hypothetical protein